MDFGNTIILVLARYLLSISVAKDKPVYTYMFQLETFSYSIGSLFRLFRLPIWKLVLQIIPNCLVCKLFLYIEERASKLRDWEWKTRLRNSFPNECHLNDKLDWFPVSDFRLKFSDFCPPPPKTYVYFLKTVAEKTLFWLRYSRSKFISPIKEYKFLRTFWKSCYAIRLKLSSINHISHSYIELLRQLKSSVPKERCFGFFACYVRKSGILEMAIHPAILLHCLVYWCRCIKTVQHSAG